MKTAERIALELRDRGKEISAALGGKEQGAGSAGSGAFPPALMRNPVAVDLAKVSLWLITLAREHALTFVDHALRHGDSLVGLTNAQIAARDWGSAKPINSPKYRTLKGLTLLVALI